MALKKKKAGKKTGTGKKGKSEAKKKKEESLINTAQASVKLWETKVNTALKSREQFRENAKLMMLQNDTLQAQMVQTEKDTIDVISYLKAKDDQKEQQLEKLQKEMIALRRDYRKEKEQIIEDSSRKINELEDCVASKNGEIDMLTGELKMVKEFRRKRGAMQKELDDIKEAMHVANREHKTTLSQMEQKFFEEKMRLQQEANQKIADLAEKAHSEAIGNLDETTRSVYKENVRLSESLNYHMKEGEVLKKRCAHLENLYTKYKNQQEENEGVIKLKMSQTHEQRRLIKELQGKVKILESSLTHVVTEFDSEKLELALTTVTETESSRAEIERLRRVIEMKTKEGNRVKRLAKHILQQRTDIERFFLEALEFVHSQIDTNQKQYRQDAKIAYNKKMLDATGGSADFPKIRTFQKSSTSTNNVFKDLEVAEKLQESESRVDIGELTWEQKERVLRYLFGRMNGGQTAAVTDKLPPLHSKSISADAKDNTFVTNQSMDDNINKHKVIPNIKHISTKVQSV